MLFSWEHLKYQNSHPGAHFGTGLWEPWGGCSEPKISFRAISLTSNQHPIRVNTNLCWMSSPGCRSHIPCTCLNQLRHVSSSGHKRLYKSHMHINSTIWIGPVLQSSLMLLEKEEEKFEKRNFIHSLQEVTDGRVVRADVSVTWNVLSWSGGRVESNLGCVVLLS